LDDECDCWSGNASPNWGALDPTNPDDPTFWRADHDGVGPELLSMPDLGPLPFLTYALAVHYLPSGPYGDTWATLRLFLHGTVIYERADVRLSEGELWQVGILRPLTWELEPWTSTQGGDLITPNYAPEWW
jgi:hypothetical protein